MNIIARLAKEPELLAKYGHIIADQYRTFPHISLHTSLRLQERISHKTHSYCLRLLISPVTWQTISKLLFSFIKIRTKGPVGHFDSFSQEKRRCHRYWESFLHIGVDEEDRVLHASSGYAPLVTPTVHLQSIGFESISFGATCLPFTL